AVPVNDAELPVGHEIMGRSQDHLFMLRVIRVEKVLFHPLPESLLYVAKSKSTEFLHHMPVYLLPVLLHEDMENRGFYIGKQYPVEKLEKGALDQLYPVDRAGLLLKLSEDICIE